MDVLIHLHIAKTGGTSLNSMIKHGFRREEIFETPLGTPGSLQQVPLQDYQGIDLYKYRYISGHVPFGLHHHLRAERCRYITLIRNPIARIISFFRFQDEDQGRYGVSFDEYVSNPIDVQLHNYQTRVLCGMPDVETIGRHQHPVITQIGDSHFALATANLEKWFLAGPIERLVELGIIVRNLYGWPMRHILAERRNPTASKPLVIPRALYNKLHDLNLYDLALHEWVTKQFIAAPLYDRFMYALTNSALCTAGKIVPWEIKKRLAQSLLYKN